MRIANRLTYANVASTLALVLVLGGGGAAVAAGIAKNSVGSPQIKAGAVKSSDLGGNAIDSSKVKDGTLSGADLKNGSVTGADVDEGSLELAATPRVASGVGDEQGALTGDGQVVASVALTAPAAGYVMVTGEASFHAAAAEGWIDAILLVDGTPRRFTYWDNGDVDGNFDEAESMTLVVPVSSGPHTFSLSVGEPGATPHGKYYRPQVTAQYFPEGSAAPQPPVEQNPI